MRSLQMKLVLIFVLLIVSVMVIVGTFMLNRVSVYYFDDFTEQMNSVFSADELGFQCRVICRAQK